MNNVFFTSDQHFNHTSLVKKGLRNFSSVEEMNEYIIDCHNAVVKPGDRVYHLGDFAWANGHEFASRLNGQNYLIEGNHDKRLCRETLDCFIWVKPTKLIRVNGQGIWMSHYPHREWPESHYGTWHLHGHCHGSIPSYGKSIDVGVDALSFIPLHFDIIQDIMQRKELIKHHGVTFPNRKSMEG